MFNWTISLSDRQVIMLMAFYSAEDDEEHSRFHAVHAMIGDAWDVRSVRKLSEDNLLIVEEFVRENGQKTNRWNITPKGEFIAMAIEQDTEMLQRLTGRNGLDSMHIINREMPSTKRALAKRRK